MTSSTLYVVATPIGNLEDMTFRAVKVLGEVDLIAAEDTRTSRILLQKYNIKTPMFSCHRFNEEKRGGFFVEKLLEGKSIALVSDAGTPCISDPGHRLVSLARKNGITVTSVCGASSVMAALSVSGFDAPKFTFLGFLPRAGAGVDVLSDCATRGGVFVFFESPKRIKKSLAKLNELSNDAKICLCNDLSKMFEKVYWGKIGDVLKELEENPDAEKGEYTCVLEAKPQRMENNDGLTLEAMILDVMIKKGISVKEAAQEVKQANKLVRKNQLFDAVLNLKAMGIDTSGKYASKRPGGRFTPPC